MLLLNPWVAGSRTFGTKVDHDPFRKILSKLPYRVAYFLIDREHVPDNFTKRSYILIEFLLGKYGFQVKAKD